MFKKILSIINIFVLVLVVIVLTLVIFQAVFNLYFLFASHDYVEYNGCKYIGIDSLLFENAIVFDENGEYSDYKGGEEVLVEINGWYPQKMILLDEEEGNYLFDYKRFIWLVKEDTIDSDLISASSISNVIAYSYKTDTNRELTQNEINLLIQQAEKIKSENNLIPDDYVMPTEDDWGVIKINSCDHSDKAYYSMFYFSVKDNNVFLMSTSNNFGFKFGQYIYVESSQ